MIKEDKSQQTIEQSDRRNESNKQIEDGAAY